MNNYSVSYHQGRQEEGATGAFCPGPLLWAPKSIYSNRTVKYSIKAVTAYILPWASQALLAALATISFIFALAI